METMKNLTSRGAREFLTELANLPDLGRKDDAARHA
jgi:hypothetical protein